MSLKITWTKCYSMSYCCVYLILQRIKKTYLNSELFNINSNYTRITQKYNPKVSSVAVEQINVQQTNSASKRKYWKNDLLKVSSLLMLYVIKSDYWK